MNQRAFNLTAGSFLVITILQLLRIVFDWSAIIGGWDVPDWVSWVAFLAAGFLAYEGFRSCQTSSQITGAILQAGPSTRNRAWRI